MNTTIGVSQIPFPKGLMDQVIADLPFGVRIDMILNWARQFATHGPESFPGIVEIIGSITALDLSHYLGLDEEAFCNLVHLPFSSSLTHLNLSHTPIGKSEACVNILSHPIFQNLVFLDLSHAQLTNIDPLFNAPHIFHNLHTLNLSANYSLLIPQIATTTQFANL